MSPGKVRNRKRKCRMDGFTGKAASYAGGARGPSAEKTRVNKKLRAERLGSLIFINPPSSLFQRRAVSSLRVVVFLGECRHTGDGPRHAAASGSLTPGRPFDCRSLFGLSAEH